MVHTKAFSLQFEGVESGKVDVEGVIREIKRLQGFVLGIEKKLGNERFIQNARKEVIDREQQKFRDTSNKIKLLKEQLKG